jgi:LmbE family N-acetylglucosaminyl deacetylase
VTWLRARLTAAATLSGTLLVVAGCGSADEAGSPDEGELVGSGGRLGTGGAAPNVGGTGGQSAGAGGSGGGTVSETGPSTVVIVAHQDDDLLFINPELEETLSRGESLTTVYLTSGNAGEGMDYVTERELGIFSAYAAMAGGEKAFDCASEPYGDKSIRTCRYTGLESAELTLLFLRLVDGWGDGHDPASLQKLWRGEIEQTTAVDGSGLSFTRTELLDTLESVLTEQGATRVLTTDFSFQHRENDHSDHESTALFVAAASGSYAAAHELRGFVTYSTTNWAANLSPEVSARVGELFALYASCDRMLDGCSGGPSCDQASCETTSSLYRSWFSRQYSSVRRAAVSGIGLESEASPGSCLAVSGDSVTLGGCTTALDYGADLTLRSGDGRCLSAPLVDVSQALGIGACTRSARERWHVMDSGQIILAAAPSESELGSFDVAHCLAAGAMGGAITLEPCADAAAQRWTF